MAFSWDAQSLRAAIDDPGLSFAALQVANQGSGRHELTGAEAVAFFTGSGLPQEALSQIWMTSTKGAPEMGPQMFLEALKLAYDALHGGQSSSQMMAGASSSGMAPPAPPSASSFGAPPSGPTPEERQKYSAHYGTLPGANSQQVSLPDAAEFLSLVDDDAVGEREVVGSVGELVAGDLVGVRHAHRRGYRDAPLGGRDGGEQLAARAVHRREQEPIGGVHRRAERPVHVRAGAEAVGVLQQVRGRRVRLRVSSGWRRERQERQERRNEPGHAPEPHRCGPLRQRRPLVGTCIGRPL
jgi:hypothetical protein